MKPWKRPELRWLIAMVLLATLLRAFLIAAPPPEMLPMGGNGEPEAINQEEILRGNTAQDLLDGPLMPLSCYQVTDFWGGSLVVAWVAVPWYALLGPRLVSLRAATLLFGALGVVFAYLLTRLAFGTRAARIAALLAAVAPPGYLFISSTAMAVHIQTSVVTLVVLLSWLHAHSGLEAGQEPRRGASVGLGVAAGFALYFGYDTLVTLALLFLFDLLLDRGVLLRRHFRWRLLGFLVGFMPWIVFNLRHGFASLTNIYGRSLLSHLGAGGEPVGAAESAGAPGALSKAVALVRTDLADAFWLREPVPYPRLVATLAAVVLVLAFALTMWRSRARLASALGAVREPRSAAARCLPEALLLAAPLAWVAAYLFSDFEVTRGRTDGYRYLYPLYLLALPGVSAALAWRPAPGPGEPGPGEQGRGRLWRIASSSVVLALCLVFLAGSAGRARPISAGQNWERPGTSTSAFGRFVILRYSGDTERLGSFVDAMVRKRPPEFGDEVLFSMAMNGRYCATRLPKADPMRAQYSSALEFLRDRVPRSAKAYFVWRGQRPRIYRANEVGRYWRERGGRPAAAQLSARP